MLSPSEHSADATNIIATIKYILFAYSAPTARMARNEGLTFNKDYTPMRPMMNAIIMIVTNSCDTFSNVNFLRRPSNESCM